MARLTDQALDHVHWFLGPLWNIYMIPSIGLSRGIVFTSHKDFGAIQFTHMDWQVAFVIITHNNYPI